MSFVNGSGLSQMSNILYNKDVWRFCYALTFESCCYYVQRTKGEPPKKLCLCGASPLGLSAMYKNLTGGDHTQVVKIKSAGIRFRFRTQQINEHLCIVCMSADTQGYNDCLFIQKKSKKHN